MGMGFGLEAARGTALPSMTTWPAAAASAARTWGSKRSVRIRVRARARGLGG